MYNKVQSNKITAQTTAQFTSCQSSVGLEGGFSGVGCMNFYWLSSVLDWVRVQFACVASGCSSAHAFWIRQRDPSTGDLFLLLFLFSSSFSVSSSSFASTSSATVPSGRLGCCEFPLLLLNVDRRMCSFSTGK